MIGQAASQDGEGPGHSRLSLQQLGHFADPVLLTALLLKLFPWTGPNRLLYANGIPMNVEYAFMLLAALLLVTAVPPRRMWTGALFEYTIAAFGVLMALVGIAYGNAVKFFIADTCDYFALSVGILWVRRVGFKGATDRLTRIYPALLVLALVSAVVATAGWVPVNTQGVARPQYFQFAILTILAPVVAANGRPYLAIGAMLCTIVLAAFAASRGAVIGGCVSLLLVILLAIRQRGIGPIFVGVALATLTTAVVFREDIEPAGVPVVRRLQVLSPETLVHEARYTEGEDVWRYLSKKGKVGLGAGFGAVIYPRWRREVGGAYSRYIHIGLLTFLLKGGMLALAACVIIPWLYVCYRLVAVRQTTLSLGFYTATLMYFIYSSMGGGWGLMAMFLYGATFTGGRLAEAEHLRGPS